MLNRYAFEYRHIGVDNKDVDDMLASIGIKTLDDLVDKTVPQQIRLNKSLDVSEAMSEQKFLEHMRQLAKKNKVFKSLIGEGFYGTFTPPVIQRNILENPGWYTQYTPYQAEISQGRLEALLNFQTVVSDLTGLPIANASLLDEATAAAEAMLMLFNYSRRKKNKKDAFTFFVDNNVFQTTIDVLKTRAEPFGIELKIGDIVELEPDNNTFGALVQYPDCDGNIIDFSSFARKLHDKGAFLAVAADILSLVLLKSPKSMGADVALGSTQRFGVPMAFGGPSAAYFACKEEYKRHAPGRIIGISIDAEDQPALRMALQTREQHIKRERATSNICTAQALLAIMAGMYAVWHGPKGLKHIAEQVHQKATAIVATLKANGIDVKTNHFFDTVRFAADTKEIEYKTLAAGFNLFVNHEQGIAGFSIDETVSWDDCQMLTELITGKNVSIKRSEEQSIPKGQIRKEPILTHSVFNRLHSETEMMRYIKQLENKDLSLTRSMIPLGSCTMKLNAASELMPISWPEFAAIHPFAPAKQTKGYNEMIEVLEKDLAEITGFAATSLQPNSGAQGEYTGLMVIRAFHEDNNQAHRNIMLIPNSAHGTNPASAIMAGYKVVVVAIDEDGSVAVSDLKGKAQQHANNLAGIMITYPGTTGIYEDDVVEVCDIVHNNGGLVYMDGANMNAQVGLTSPGAIGADVCHLNLHKTFAIPHGGGGPGVGPICVNEKLKPYLPQHHYVKTGGNKGITAVSSSPYGSAGVLPISYGYIKMMGSESLTAASVFAILNANYMAYRLKEFYDVMYLDKNGFVAHEFILDLRPFKKTCDVDAEDVAKRLMDFGFHAPTMSWPIPGTIMIEPTESESKAELDRLVDALIAIRKEIEAIESGKITADESPLKQAPHTLKAVIDDEWKRPYSRQTAAFPADWIMKNKFWPAVARINNGYGDRNLMCTCDAWPE